MNAVRTALVTGATGFVGSALVRRLSREGVRVACLVRGHGPKVARLSDLPGVEPIDWADVRRFGRLPQWAPQPDAVFHLASYGVQPGDRDLGKIIDGNVHLIAELLQAIAHRPPQAFLHTGSCYEYGVGETGVLMNEERRLDPATVYGSAKAASVVMGAAIARRLSVPLATLRLFGVYGPGEAPDRLVPYLVDRLRRDQSAELTAGEQVRDLTFIDDVVEAYIAAARRCDRLEPYSVYNVCSAKAVRIRDICTTVARTLDKPDRLLDFGARPYRSDEPMWIVGDHARLTHAIGWRPRIDLDKGLRITTDYLLKEHATRRAG